MEVAIEQEETPIWKALDSALRHLDDDKVIYYCSKLEEGPFHKCTIHKDTVLHVVASTKRFEVANRLVDDLPENLIHKLDSVNDWGHTVLHHACASNRGFELVNKLLDKRPLLLLILNKWGESAVFQAARNGKAEIFNFLAGKVDDFCASHPEYNLLYFFGRRNKVTVLHMAILMRKFDLAFTIAKRYPQLCDERTQLGVTALQILACCPTAFKSGATLSLLKQLIYSCVSTKTNEIGNGSTYIRVILPVAEAVREEKKCHEDALKLAKLLIPSDISWKNTQMPFHEEYPDIYIDEGVDSREAQIERKSVDEENGKTSKDESGISKKLDTPLLLACETGCMEIVEQILEEHPLAAGYINLEKQNFLHVAVKNRKLDVRKLVDQLSPFERSMLRYIDSKGNSIIHMVALREEVAADAKMKSPVLQLSEELLLLEYLEKQCPMWLVHHRNLEGWNARELFAKENEKLRVEAKEWLKRTAESCTVVIVLIATVAFAAAYTIPGGPNQQTGQPILLEKPFFLVFTVTDVLSLGFALTAVVVFLSILTSSYQLKDFRRSLPQKLLIGFTLLFLSVSMMMVSFAATIILMITNRERWTKIAVYIVAFFPVFIFALSYLPLYVKLVDTFKDWVQNIRKSLPRFVSAPKLSRLPT